MNYMEKTSEDLILTNLLCYFIIRRMVCGYHQIFCNFISSDMERNISIGKLSRENEKKKKTSKENHDTLLFKLQIDLGWGEGGMDLVLS